MSPARSRLALWTGAILMAAGLIGEIFGLHLLPLIVIGAIVFASSYVEPLYGLIAKRPPNGEWHATAERFVDPATGKLVTVWQQPATGERRYVSDPADRPS